MSVKALFWALEQRIPTNPKIVLIHLSDWFNELEDSAWPSIPKLVERTGLSRSTVIRSTQWLVDNKLVLVEHRFSGGWKKSNRYRLAIGVMAIQGCHSDTTVVSETTGLKCQSDTSIDTVKDTVKDTVISAAPTDQSNSMQKKETSVKLEDIDLNPKKSKDEIFDRFKLTPKGCGDLWKDCHAASGEHGKCVLPNNTASSVLKNCAGKLDDDTDFRKVVWGVMHNWSGFGKYCESHDDSPGHPLNPRINFFAAHLEAAVNFTKAAVQLTAKPLTNKPAPCTPIPKVKKVKEPAITLQELLAMNKDDE